MSHVTYSSHSKFPAFFIYRDNYVGFWLLPSMDGPWPSAAWWATHAHCFCTLEQGFSTAQNHSFGNGLPEAAPKHRLSRGPSSTTDRRPHCMCWCSCREQDGHSLRNGMLGVTAVQLRCVDLPVIPTTTPHGAGSPLLALSRWTRPEYSRSAACSGTATFNIEPPMWNK